MRGTAGDVVGRTSWVGRPDWARGFTYSPAELLAIVEKAIAGRHLGRLQRAIMDAMLEEIDFADLEWLWGRMSEDEKDSSLDALFGADTRPARPLPARPLVPADLADFVRRQLAA